MADRRLFREVYPDRKLLVEEAGGKMIFYEMQDGKIIPFGKLEVRHYDPSKKAVGFIAANPILAQQFMDILLQIQ